MPEDRPKNSTLVRGFLITLGAVAALAIVVMAIMMFGQFKHTKMEAKAFEHEHAKGR